MSNPSKALPSLEQVATAVASIHHDQQLFRKIAEAQRDQLALLNESLQLLQEQVAELNLQMLFVMGHFKFQQKTDLVGPDGKVAVIVKTLGDLYTERRPSLLERIDTLIEGAPQSHGKDSSESVETDAPTTPEASDAADAADLHADPAEHNGTVRPFRHASRTTH